MTPDDRRLEVLKAIIEDYVATQEPVGSKALTRRRDLDVSSATIRNDMAVLEEEGLISAPHTSSGRVPTEKGYRFFVDRLATIKPLSAPEKRAIRQFLESSVDLDDVVHRTVRLLAQLTQQVAVVQYPSLTRSTVRHVELVPLNSVRILLVLITDTGRVEQRSVELRDALSERAVADLRAMINNVFTGRLLFDAPHLVEELLTAAGRELRSSVIVLSGVLLEMMAERHEERVVLGGTANLSDSAVEFGGSIRPVLQALEEHVVLLKLLDHLDRPSDPLVRIGDETQVDELRGTSVVTAGYGSADTVYAGLGVLGPTRMDYPTTIVTVRAVARYVGEFLSRG